MSVVLREDLVRGEDLIRDSLEALKLNLIKQRLEETFSNDNHLDRLASLSESLRDAHLTLDELKKLGNDKNPQKQVSILKRVEAKIAEVTDKNREYLSSSQISILERTKYLFALWRNLVRSTTTIKENLTEESSLKTLKSWSNCISLMSELVELEPSIFVGDVKNPVQNLAEKVLETTSKKDAKETQKSQYKRSIRNSAMIILDRIKDNEIQAWQIVVGKKSYREQIEASKRKIHLLDCLQPKNEEEAKEQEDTLRYVEEYLD